MKRILLGLLIFLIIAPVACGYCDIDLQIDEEGTCGNYKIRHDGWSTGDLFDYQIAHFHLGRLSPYADLGSDSLDCWHDIGGRYYDGNKLHVRYIGSGGDPREAHYRLEDLTPQLTVQGFFNYKDRNLNYAPGKWATVWIWDEDSGSGDDYLGSAFTDENGYFEFGPINNTDWDEDGGKLDIYVGFGTISSIGNITDANSITHHYYMTFGYMNYNGKLN